MALAKASRRENGVSEGWGFLCQGDMPDYIQMIPGKGTGSEPSSVVWATSSGHDELHPRKAGCID